MVSDLADSWCTPVLIQRKAKKDGRHRSCRRFLDAGYRRPLILAELLGFNADIVCLQEVDEKAFAVYFRPHLSLAGAQQLESSSAITVDEWTVLSCVLFPLC